MSRGFRIIIAITFVIFGLLLFIWSGFRFTASDSTDHLAFTESMVGVLIVVIALIFPFLKLSKPEDKQTDTKKTTLKVILLIVILLVMYFVVRQFISLPR